MKVVKDNYHKSKYVVTCRSCNSIFMLDDLDLSGIRCDGNRNTFRCPYCYKKQKLEYKELGAYSDSDGYYIGRYV